MKIFKYKFTKLMTVLIYAGLALSVVAFALTLYFVFTEGISSAVNPFYPILQYSLMFLVSVLLFVILISLLLSSYYSIDGNTLKTSFGIIKSKYDIAEVDTVILDRTTKKLSLYFKNNNYIVIVVKEDWYDDFISAILKANPEINFSIKSKENDIDENKKK